MNADFEMELASPGGGYRRRQAFDKINSNLTKHLLWLAEPGDTILVETGELTGALSEKAFGLGIEIASPDSIHSNVTTRSLMFTPWGWTESAIEVGKLTGAIVEPISTDIVRRVNSKLWSFALEQELGIALPGSGTASTFEELKETINHACPGINDKWVIKSHLGFAARDRVLGRGPGLQGPQATWARRRIAASETLIFQPWLHVVREYGVAIFVGAKGQVEIQGISDLQTNGAGTGVGYLLGRKIEPVRVRQLEEIAMIVGERLFREGFAGPAGIDALEHSGGLHPLLEVNARYTMGFVAVAVERSLRPASPVLWSYENRSVAEA